jgi:uncharacterized protein YcbK (DUF882 family)
MGLSRRRLLLAGMAGAGLARAVRANPLANPLANPRANPPANDAASRRIALLNLHTNEQLDIEYFRNGEYVADALAKIRQVLRDFRNGEAHAIDPALMDYLVEVAAKLGKDARFSVISGYRSPETNEKLQQRSSGVAQHSLHMQGRAIDVRMAGIDCSDLAGRAENLRRGGVGYYRASNFVHLDTGAFRTWRG